MPLEWLLYSAGDPTERAPDDCSRGQLFDIGPERVNIAPGRVDRRTEESDTRSLSDSRFGEGERQRLLTIEDKSIKNNL